MPALRERDPGHISEASTSRTTRRSAKSRLKSRRNTEKVPNAAPGVQKIKAALRQTRRLLAKVCVQHCWIIQHGVTNFAG